VMQLNRCDTETHTIDLHGRWGGSSSFHRKFGAETLVVNHCCFRQTLKMLYQNPIVTIQWRPFGGKTIGWNEELAVNDVDARSDESQLLPIDVSQFVLLVALSPTEQNRELLPDPTQAFDAHNPFLSEFSLGMISEGGTLCLMTRTIDALVHWIRNVGNVMKSHGVQDKQPVAFFCTNQQFLSIFKVYVGV
jgi:hypothetical protein